MVNKQFNNMHNLYFYHTSMHMHCKAC